MKLRSSFLQVTMLMVYQTNHICLNNAYILIDEGHYL